MNKLMLSMSISKIIKRKLFVQHSMNVNNSYKLTAMNMFVLCIYYQGHWAF